MRGIWVLVEGSEKRFKTTVDGIGTAGKEVLEKMKEVLMAKRIVDMVYLFLYLSFVLLRY